MQNLATYTRPSFLGDHPPVLARMLLASDGEAKTILAGSVLGRDSSGKLGPWSADFSDAAGVLAGDVDLPAEGDAIADVYIHASVVASELVFGPEISQDAMNQALAALRLKGIYSDVAWAAPMETPPNDQEKTPPDDDDENSSPQEGD